MGDPILGELRQISFNYAPRGWAFCNGQLLPIAQNQALFALLGTMYGGDGRTTFALPDLRGRVPVSQGQLPGGSSYTLGQTGGLDAVTLITTELPAHTHPVTGTLQTAAFGDPSSPQGNYLASDANAQFGAGPASATMGGTAQGTSDNAGGSQPHENRQPVLALNYVIALQGAFPTRN
ncbi:phage tail protein [Hymenobacter ruricola]|uniref:Phage tail protein n=1 Tax=Hymenobacter ruricola TaxID=2791023 RepID=A0ABS0I7P3_9BACT|nr:tail fiber protein [Hymenobacter ruricola]MBF9222991.1 phage tail protein [Hymenobacter ruricola]